MWLVQLRTGFKYFEFLTNSNLNSTNCLCLVAAELHSVGLVLGQRGARAQACSSGSLHSRPRPVSRGAGRWGGPVG